MSANTSRAAAPSVVQIERVSAPSPHQIDYAMSILTRARDTLGEDPELIADEQRLFDYLASAPETCEEAEIIPRLIKAIRAAEQMEEAVDSALEEMLERRSRWRNRVDFLRRQTQACMDALGIRKVIMPEATARIQQSRDSVVILDEEQIPDEFCRIEREVKKTPIADAIKSGRAVPGAVLSNTGSSLVISFR